MFGYVRPSVRDLPEEELDRFRAMYCGLCHTLSRRYGQAARFILNYDFTYLAILLSDGMAGAQGTAGRCYTSPIKKRPFLEPTAAMELAADESVISSLLAAAGRRGGSRLGLRPEIPGRGPVCWNPLTNGRRPFGRNSIRRCAASFSS